jgi:hypothetical protein
MKLDIVMASFQCHRTSKSSELGYSIDETNHSADYDIFRISLPKISNIIIFS